MIPEAGAARIAKQRADGPNAGKKSGALGRDISADLETQIVEGRLSPGAKLDELALGNHYSVSRTPVREALRVLAAKGLVEFQPRIGAIVARPTVGEVMDLFEIVAEMEGVTARLASERMEAADKDRIVDAYWACQQAASSSDPEEYFATNGEFHRSIQEASHNRMLIEQIEHLNKRLSPYRRFITFRLGRTQTAMKEHEAVFEALLRRDGETAATSMRNHVRVLAEDSLALSKSLRF